MYSPVQSREASYCWAYLGAFLALELDSTSDRARTLAALTPDHHALDVAISAMRLAAADGGDTDRCVNAAATALYDHAMTARFARILPTGDQ